jgi:hypothetical protein
LTIHLSEALASCEAAAAMKAIASECVVSAQRRRLPLIIAAVAISWLVVLVAEASADSVTFS